LANLFGGQNFSIPLDNSNGVSKTGYTGLRTHISGGMPTNTHTNQACFASYDHATLPAPALSVTYSNPPPTITSAADSPDPVTAGSPMTFTVGWNDPGDTVRALICKTSAISAGSCAGGEWAAGVPSSISPTTVSFSPS